MCMARYEIILKFDNSSRKAPGKHLRDMRIRILNHPICRIIQRDMGKEFISPSCCEVVNIFYPNVTSAQFFKVDCVTPAQF